MKTVTLSTLVADTGETPRTLNSWSDFGLLRALRTTERMGRGTRRRYPAEPLYGERKYALMASGLVKLRLPLNDIKRLIYAQRLSHDPMETIEYVDAKHAEYAKRIRAERVELQDQHPGFVEPFEAALAGEPDIYLVIAVRAHDQLRPFQSAYLRQSPEDPTMAAKGNNKLMLNLMADNPAAVVLNLSKVFEPLLRPVDEEQAE